MKRRISLPDILDPVLSAAEKDDRELGEAVSLVAESLATMGVAFVDPLGAPAQGVTDENAVATILDHYRQRLIELHEFGTAEGVSQLIDRVVSLRRDTP